MSVIEHTEKGIKQKKQLKGHSKKQKQSKKFKKYTEKFKKITYKSSEITRSKKGAKHPLKTDTPSAKIKNLDAKKGEQKLPR